MEEILYRFNPWWEEEYKPEFLDRPRYTTKLLKSIENKNIEIITGLRRIGKTTILKLLIHKLIKEKKTDPSRIFYISLDFYGLEDISILEVVEQFFKIQEIRFGEKVYLFLDEITYKKDFSQQLKNLYDHYNAKIFATSSSSSVLKDKKAFLTGRESLTEVLPLSFQEFLSFKNIKIKKSDKHLIPKLFERYMEIGGIPEYVLNEDIEYIKQLIDDIIYKDIISFHNIKDKTIIREFFYLLMERAGKQVSLNKISKILGISVDTARRYFEHFKDTYLIYSIERCGKLNERIKSPKKIYSGDIGIKNAVTGFRDKGAVFENLVFLNIKDKNPCYIYQGGVELDFLLEDKTLIEVKYESFLNEKQKKLFDTFPANKKILIDTVEKFLTLFG
ncbi:ATP-binding protein [Persephonella sp.]